MRRSTTAPGPKRKKQIAKTKSWGAWGAVSLYLQRCQVDTPHSVVSATWAHIHSIRKKVGKVVDFGAGDGRFAAVGRFDSYVGYEIDEDRCKFSKLPKHATLVNHCAFEEQVTDADVCIGNPPFVRNQDLPSGWRVRAAKIIQQRIGVRVSGLANAWQYFFLLALASCKPDGLCALVVPYEWVSRPSAKELREFIRSKGWDVSVYRLVDATFDSVLTTSSITIVDLSTATGNWQFFEETRDGKFRALDSASGSIKGVVNYSSRRAAASKGARAVRGLSPGTQRVLTLTEGERARAGLRPDRDVVPCVTTLRHIPENVRSLTPTMFKEHFRDSGAKCWLLRTDVKPSSRLEDYLAAVPVEEYQTSTCLEREEWWRFKMPPPPTLLMAQSFRRRFPKILENSVRAIAVGGVCGIHEVARTKGRLYVERLTALDMTDRVVAHSNGLRKIEINQINAILQQLEASLQKGRT